MLKKTKFWVHCVIATAFIFGFMWTASQIFAIFDFLDPIGDALAGYEVTDQVFSNPQWRDLPPADTNVVLVNIGTQSRRVIAEQLNMINRFDPKVVGLDTYFGVLKPDTFGDLLLADAIANSSNLVMYAKLIEPTDTNGVWKDVIYSHPMFTQDKETASVNLINDEEAGSEQFEVKTCRNFFPQEYLLLPDGGLDTVNAFGVALAMHYAPEKAKRFLARDNDEEIVNYTGNVVDFGRTRLGNRFYAMDWHQILDSTMFFPDLIKDKIVIMCFLGETLSDTRSFEDKYFTPLNSRYTGRANPDMYGGVVHANITSMILSEEYLDEMEEWQAKLLAVLVCFLNVVVFSMVYHKMDNWYDGVTKLMQLLEALILTFVIILVFHFYNFKLNLTYTIIAVLFAGDTLEVYYGVIVNTWERIEKKWLTKST